MTSISDRIDALNRPKRPGLRRKHRLRFWTAFISGILLLGLLFNQYMAWNQDLYIVNGFAGPLTVSIDEGESITVRPEGHKKVSISEGDHVAVVSRPGAEDHTVKFTVENTISHRLGNDSAFVLNPGASGVLVQQDIVYSASPRPTAPNSYKLCFGEEFFVFRGIDYAFETPPDKIELDTASKVKTKKSLGAVQGRPVNLLMSVFPEGTQDDERLRFVEHFLTVDHNDSKLLWSYVGMVRFGPNRQRAAKFLRANLGRRPISVDWHRAYQSVCDTGNDDEIIATYDRMLAEAPNDSVLLYLRGRLCATRNQSAKYFNRAIKADPKNPYPSFAIAYGLMSAGQLDEARKYSATACRLSPDHDQMATQLLEIRLVLKEYDSLAAELRAKLAAEPLDLSNHTNLLRALVASGKTAEAGRANEKYLKHLSDAGHDTPILRGHIERILAYLLGDSRRLADLSPEERNDPDTAAMVGFINGLESGDPQRIGELVKEKKYWEISTNMLLLGLAWQVAGDRSAAEKCFDDAAGQLASGDRDEREAARLLKQGDKMQLNDVDNLSCDRQSKAITLVALAAGSPSNRTALLDRAEKLNILGLFPHHLIRKAIASLRTGEKQ